MGFSTPPSSLGSTGKSHCRSIIGVKAQSLDGVRPHQVNCAIHSAGKEIPTGRMNGLSDVSIQVRGISSPGSDGRWSRRPPYDPHLRKSERMVEPGDDLRDSKAEWSYHQILRLGYPTTPETRRGR